MSHCICCSCHQRVCCKSSRLIWVKKFGTMSSNCPVSCPIMSNHASMLRLFQKSSCVKAIGHVLIQPFAGKTRFGSIFLIPCLYTVWPSMARLGMLCSHVWLVVRILTRLALERYETHHAVRQRDVAVTLKGAGSGSNRRWTPHALLRVAFGHSALSSIKSKLLRKSPCVFSLNSTAYWLKSCTGHIAQAVVWPNMTHCIKPVSYK